ncbi:MAG: hypothetical protein IPH42_07230 [Bacteroidetes bacterium]|nr:hypothetical protein [Bacteroidota bacterium]
MKIVIAGEVDLSELILQNILLIRKQYNFIQEALIPPKIILNIFYGMQKV